MERDYEDEFYLIAEGGEIHLKVVEVFGFPSDKSFMGGYDSRSVIDIRCGKFSAKGNVYITTGQLYEFLQELKECYRVLTGTATLNDYEGSLQITFDFDGLGHVKVAGSYREDLSQFTELNFEMDTDQTRIPQVISGLEDLAHVYGDERGVFHQRDGAG